MKTTKLVMRLFQGSLLPISQLRLLQTTASQLGKALPPRPKVLETDLDEAFLKGSGPGGQKINKTNSAVQLRHIPTGIVVKCQETRSRDQNRKIARQILAEKIDVLAKGDESRASLKAAEIARKKKSKAKKSARKYKKHEEEKLETSGDSAQLVGAVSAGVTAASDRKNRAEIVDQLSIGSGAETTTRDGRG